jgi:hypothetical protein
MVTLYGPDSGHCENQCFLLKKCYTTNTVRQFPGHWSANLIVGNAEQLLE